MKKEVTPGMMAAIIAVVVLVIGFITYRTFFQNTNVSPDSAEARKLFEETHKNSAILQNMQGLGNRGAHGSAGGAGGQQAQPGGGQ